MIKHPDLIFDVGLHRGEDSEFYLKKGFRVVAFEAAPDLVRACRTRFAKQIAQGRLVIVEGAIVGNPLPGQTVTFYRNPSHSMWGTVCTDWAKRNVYLGSSSDTISVPAIDFVAALKTYGIPYYLKVDIEGMDRVCLKALQRFDCKPDFLSIESEKRQIGDLLEEIDLLETLGYTSFKAVQQEQIGRQREPTPAREKRRVGHHFPEGASGLFGRDLPGAWLDSDAVKQRYRRIFMEYRLFGDFGLFSKFWLGRALRKMLKIALRRPLPGWYDTHAKHHSAGL